MAESHQYSTVQYSTVHYSTVLCNAVKYINTQCPCLIRGLALLLSLLSLLGADPWLSRDNTTRHEAGEQVNMLSLQGRPEPAIARTCGDVAAPHWCLPLHAATCRQGALVE